MEFKYIAFCVILFLIYDTTKAKSIHHRIQLSNFAEYDILDILNNSKNSNANLKQKFSGIGIEIKQLNNTVVPAFMKIHHGACSKNFEYTLYTSSSPAFKSYNHSISSEIEVNGSSSITVKCCSTINSPNIIPEVNTTRNTELNDTSQSKINTD